MLKYYYRAAARQAARAGIEVSSKNIYIWNGEQYDNTRWISIAHRGPETCVLYLTDLCEPGRLSHLSSVTCPKSYLRTCLEHGPLQLTVASGFVLMSRRGDTVQFEFRGRDDVSTVKVHFKAEDLVARLDAGHEDTEFAPTLATKR